MQKNTILFLIINLFIWGIFIFPSISQSASVPLSYNPNRLMTTAACGPVPIALVYAVPILSDTCIVSNVNTYVSLSKSFQLNRGGVLLPQWNASVNVGDSIIGASPVATNTVGSFTMAGSGYGTPPLDNTTVANQWIPFTHNGGIWTTGANFQFWGGLADASTYTLSSSNPAAISCSGTACTAVGPGTANITANFNANGSYYYVYQNSTYVPPSGSLTPGFAISPFTGLLEWVPYCNSLPAVGWTSPLGTFPWLYAVSVLYPCGFPGVTMGPNIVREAFTPQPVTYYNVTSIVPNSPPTVSNVRAEDIAYTEATIRWNYTDPENNPQTQAQVQVARDASFTNIVANIPINNASLEQRVTTGLIAGTQYYIRARATDGQASRTINTAPWVNGTSFRTRDYPTPSVSYILRNGSNTANPGQTLTVSSGDRIDIEWNITNNEGLTQCNASTQTTAGGGNDQVFSGTNIGFTGSRLQVEPPLVLADRTYRLRITCPARPTNQAVSPAVDRFITLRVLTRPVVSCTVQNTVVTSSNPIARVNVTVTNGLANYTWQTDNGSGGGYSATTIPSGTNTTPTLDIDYSSTTAPGKYQPSVRVRDGNGRQDDAVCSSEVTNLGNRSIREVNP